VSRFFECYFSIPRWHRIIHSNGPWYMPQEPVPPDPGRDGDPSRVPSWPEWIDDPAYLAMWAVDDDPGDPNHGANTPDRYWAVT
jgi:hypothetical protein